MKKKRIAIVVIIGIILLGIIGLIVLFGGNKNSDSAKKYDETDINKYQWIELLALYSGMTEYDNEKPYYTDVDVEDEYFGVVQAAVEWEIIEEGNSFNGDNKASGRFVAITAIKSVGEKKLQIYLGTNDELTDEDYLNIALENDVISKENLENGISIEEAEQVIEKLESLYFGVFWKTDVENVVYKESVIQIDANKVAMYDKESEEIEIVETQLSKGDIFVFEKNGFVIARRVKEVTDSGTYILEMPDLDEVVESLVQSDIIEMTFQDIINYYGEENVILSQAESEPNVMMVSHTISGETNSKGFAIIVEEDKGKLSISVKDNDTGVQAELPISPKTDLDNLNVNLDVNKIFVGTQIKYGAFSGVEYADVAVDINSEFKGGIAADGEIDDRLILFETPVPLGSGVVGVDIQIYLVTTVEGEIYLEANIPFQNTVHYEKGKGIRNISHELSVEEPHVEASAEIETKVRVAPILVVLQTEPILDAELDMGVATKIEIESRDNSQICTDVNVAFPIINIMIGDENIRYYGKRPLLAEIGITAEWEIINFDNAPKKFGFHHEILPSGLMQYVFECTYGQDEIADDNIIGIDDEMLVKLLNGDFSDFAGTYKPLDVFHDWYGGGGKIGDLHVDSKGILSGCETYYYERPFPQISPIDVTKNEDGSYHCTITESEYIYDEGIQSNVPVNNICSFDIYPEGVVGENTYGADADFLKGVVYIVYTEIDGGVFDILCYKEDEETALMPDYDGDDWVACDVFKDEIGEKFISGTGVTYEVIGIERNDDAGREAVVLLREDGSKYLVTNMPAFKVDTEVGIAYWEIYEYFPRDTYYLYEGRN